KGIEQAGHGGEHLSSSAGADSFSPQPNNLHSAWLAIRRTYGERAASCFPDEPLPPKRGIVTKTQHHRFAFPALVVGSSALALGPWLVRLSGVGPVAAGFWRLSLALPFLFVIAAFARQAVHWPGRRLALIAFAGAFFFAMDLIAWHIGIHLTKLGNATLFGNMASFAFAA